jgi:uncharacterized protein YsxB (DUF464 family)
MSEVKIFRNAAGGNEICKYVFSGHTGYAEAGGDIVCAALSALAMNALNGLTDVVGARVGFEAREGYIECVLPEWETLSAAEKAGARALLESMALSVRSLAAQYGDFISLKELKI